MQPAALAIGGLDPTCGAGLGADLRAFAAAGAWGCAACAALTVQSTRGLRHVHAVETSLLRAQVEELLSDVPVRAVKTGALGSVANVRWVARLARKHQRIPWVVDPVLQPTRRRQAASRGVSAGLCGEGAVAALRELAAAAFVLTPNRAEAEALLAGRIQSDAQAREAAAALRELGAWAVLLKGGHLADGDRPARGWVVDWLATEGCVRRLARRRIAGPELHGTGCTLAALVAGRLAGLDRRALDGEALAGTVRWATQRLARMMRSAGRIGSGLGVLGTRAGRWSVDVGSRRVRTRAGAPGGRRDG